MNKISSFHLKHDSNLELDKLTSEEKTRYDYCTILIQGIVYSEYKILSKLNSSDISDLSKENILTNLLVKFQLSKSAILLDAVSSPFQTSKTKNDDGQTCEVSEKDSSGKDQKLSEMIVQFREEIEIISTNIKKIDQKCNEFFPLNKEDKELMNFIDKIQLSYKFKE